MDSRLSVDNTDWLKTAAIILVTVDHLGFFFMEDDLWWGAFGRLAAPVFFFLMGYAKTRYVPLKWLWLGISLTLLESWNEDWTWAAPNIFFSFILIRLARPHVLRFVKHQGWLAFVILASVLMAALPFAVKIVDYGAEGWLWAFFGLYQRLYVDGRSAKITEDATAKQATGVPKFWKKAGPVRLSACLLAAAVYIWQEQKEYLFPGTHFAVVILGVVVLAFCLCLFMRGPSLLKPPISIAATLRFMGRHTLEIYAIQLAASELLVRLLPDLTP